MLKHATCLLAVGTLFLAACGESVTAPEPQLNDADITFLTELSDADLASMLNDFLGTDTDGPSSAPAQSGHRVTTRSWEKTRDCRAGGHVTIAGSSTRTWHRETKTYDVASSGTKTRTDCARVRGETTITLNGSMAWTHERHYVARAPVGNWITAWAGSFDWAKSSGESGTCAISLTRTVDTAANTVSPVGTFCGRDVDRSRTWRDAPP
jgi:hypothetical protein